MSSRLPREKTHFEQRLQERCQVSDELLDRSVGFVYSQLANGQSCFLHASDDGTEVHAVQLFHSVVPVRWDPRTRTLVSALPVITLYDKQLTSDAHRRLGALILAAHDSWLTRR